VLTTRELELDVLTPLLGLLSPGLGLDDVRELDDEVEFPRCVLLIDRVEQVQRPKKALQSRVRLVHHAVERVLDDAHERLLESDVLALPSRLVVDANAYVTGMPRDDAADPHVLDVPAPCQFGVESRFHGNDAQDATVEERQGVVLEQCPCGLVDVRLERQAIVETALDCLLVVAVFVRTNVVDRDRSHVESETVVQRADDRAFGAEDQSRTVRPT
jgi:hypothetical protein